MIDIIDDKQDSLLDQFLDSTQFQNVLEEDYFMEAYWELDEDEQQICIQQVVYELQKMQDPRAPRFFRIAEIQNCLETLEAVLPQATGLFRMETLWSMMMIGNPDDYMPIFIDTLIDPDPMVRRVSALRVSELKRKEFLPILFELLNDDDIWVLHNAVKSICQIAGLPAFQLDPFTNILPVVAEIFSSSKKVKLLAITSLQKLVAAKLDGKTNEALDLQKADAKGFNPNFKAFAKHWYDNQSPQIRKAFPVDLLKKLTKRQKLMGSILLLEQLNEYNSHAARALTEMKVGFANQVFILYWGKMVPPEFALELARGMFLLSEDMAGFATIQRLLDHPNGSIRNKAKETVAELEAQGAVFAEG